MDRRTFLGTLALGLLASPLAAEAQEAKTYRIGVIDPGPPSLDARPAWKGFLQQLREAGYAVGQNLEFVFRHADRPDRLLGYAEELVRLRVDLILTGGTPPTHAAQVLKDAVPKLSRIAVMWNAANPVNVIDFDHTRRAGKELRLTVFSIEVRALTELETAFAEIVRLRPDALLILADQLLSPVVRPRIAQCAIQRHVPSIAGNSNYAAAGGLCASGPPPVELYHIVARQVASILNGANPAEIPVAQPSKLELAINLKTAKALGLTIPPSLLQRADQVIE